MSYVLRANCSINIFLNSLGATAANTSDNGHWPAAAAAAAAEGNGGCSVQVREQPKFSSGNVKQSASQSARAKRAAPVCGCCFLHAFSHWRRACFCLSSAISRSAAREGRKEVN